MAVFTALSLLLPASLGSLTVFGLSAQVTAAIFSVGRAVTWSLASAALQKQPSIPRQQIMANINQTDQPRIRAYGRVLLGGPRAFWEAYADGGALFQIVVLHHGGVDGLISYWVDGERVTVRADGAVTSPPFETGDDNPDIILDFRNGRDTPVAGIRGGYYPEITAQFPTLWTANHRLDEQATMYARFDLPAMERMPKIFPKGANTVLQAEIRSSLVLTGAGLAYSENAAWCNRDYLTHQDGWRIDPAFIDGDSFADFAALCGEIVGTRGGGTEQRYRVSGYYTLNDAPKDVSARLLAACDGQIYQTAEGKVGILGGRWSEPDVTITADDIMAFEAKDGFDPFSDFNVLKATFISPAHGYQPTEVAERRDDVALLTQPERVEQMDLDMVPSGSQAQRLQKIAAAKKKRALTGTLTTNLVGLKARFPKGDGIHTIRIDAPEAGLDGVFEVMSHRFSIPDGWCEIGIASIENPYDWDALTEDFELPPALADLQKPVHVIPPPAGASLTQVPVRISGDTWGGKLRLTVTPSLRADLELQAQVAKGDRAATWPGEWAAMAGDRSSAETGILENEAAYTVRYRWRGQTGWQKAGTVTIVANPNVPGTPTAFARVGASGVTLEWTNPPDNFWKSRLFRGATTDFADASFVKDVAGLAGEKSTATHSPGAGTHRYFVVALNGSSVASLPAGPISITI